MTRATLSLIRYAACAIIAACIFVPMTREAIAARNIPPGWTQNQTSAYGAPLILLRSRKADHGAYPFITVYTHPWNILKERSRENAAIRKARFAVGSTTYIVCSNGERGELLKTHNASLVMEQLRVPKGRHTTVATYIRAARTAENTTAIEKLLSYCVGPIEKI